MIFDLLSAEYGWETEYIFSRTMKEISWRIESISKRQNIDMRFNAQIHGVKMKDRPKINELSEDKQKKLDKIIQARIKNG